MVTELDALIAKGINPAPILQLPAPPRLWLAYDVHFEEDNSLYTRNRRGLEKRSKFMFRSRFLQSEADARVCSGALILAFSNEKFSGIDAEPIHLLKSNVYAVEVFCDNPKAADDFKWLMTTAGGKIADMCGHLFFERSRDDFGIPPAEHLQAIAV